MCHDISFDFAADIYILANFCKPFIFLNYIDMKSK